MKNKIRGWRIGHAGLLLAAIATAVGAAALGAAGIPTTANTNSNSNSTSNAPPISLITTNFYVFGGTNGPQMRAAMIEARPWKQDMKYDAHTKWDVTSHYRYGRSNGEFRLKGIEVKTKVSVTLPMWIPGKPVSRELVNRWQKCFIGLSVHEQGHVQLAVAAGAEVKRRLDELAGFNSPQDLTAAAESALKDTLEQFRERERKYDQVTGHGRTQGAVFPVEVIPEEDVVLSSGPTNGFPRRPGARRR